MLKLRAVSALFGFGLNQRAESAITAECADWLAASTQIELRDLLEAQQQRVRAAMPGNPATDGFKVYSQADEDGIIESIANRLAIAAGRFVEIGCGDGSENNSHYLLLKGWDGVWIDGGTENIQRIKSQLPLPTRRLTVRQAIVDKANVVAEVRAALQELEGSKVIDLLSIDIDGNDLDVALPLVDALQPRILVVEYNARFPPPVELAIAYNPAHTWAGDDYHGASLQSWVNALTPRYQLIACCIAGINAFFSLRELAGEFGAYTTQMLYQPARFELTRLRSGHVPSLKFLSHALAKDAKTTPPSKP